MRLPMFPLGTVLFPGALLPLHVFEPRYRTMVRTCLEGDGSFGVVLIERGSEVGGGDVRTDVGTLARIVEAQETADGRWALLALGTGRLRVWSWLPDDPHPIAEVERWDDPVPASAALAGALDAALAALRRLMALRAELGDAVAAIPEELAADPGLATYQLCALAPITTIDRQRLLAAESTGPRVELLQQLLAEESEVLELRLGGA